MQNPVSPREAREQASEYLGLVTSVIIKADNSNELFEIPNPNMLDDEQQQRYDQMQLDMEDLDRHPSWTDHQGNVRKGNLLEPHRKGGKLVDNYNVRLAKVIFGDEGYQRFRAAGGRSADVGLVWGQMNAALTKRRAEDSKSSDSNT
jgi:hypothetical protein